ncbi:DUF928 domain-containing protein [Microcoleus sp. FACHB-1515]|uniref:DUF928 domain-containing protein n=1 Tax=Cyanophyceae TaxID=3028117 RepID=UPI0016888E76|nr:DUF928 domain-containing protein [Microcoleus sp. FACHB-1515]MBD2088835.1 DUF928 domain-containing protein [Microcoleus sp. FACHB-1515]
MRNFNLIGKCSMILVALAIGCSLQAVSAQTVSDAVTISQRPPNPPPSPPPNDTRPGGGLSPQDSSCNPLNRSMQALIPVTNPVLTTTNSPTFLFYIPFAADQVQFGEFTLLAWPGEEQRLHQIRFTLPQTPGIVSISLPPQTELQEGNSYRWYFQLYCQDGTGTQPDLTVNGMVERVALTPDRERQIRDATPDIWYDALAQVAGQLQASPQDAQLREKWRSLLQTIDAEDLAQEAIVGSIIPLPAASSGR